MAIQFRHAARMVALLSVVQSARQKRTGSRSFAGVPVKNYQADVQDWLILFNEGTTDETMHSICQGACAIMGQPNKGGTPFVKVHGSEQEVEQMVGQNPSLMQFVEPDETDYVIPAIEDQQMDAAATASWGLERIGVPTRASSGSGVHIYVQGTGVRASHEDFGGRVIPTIDLNFGTKRECKGDMDCAIDRHGQGTYCAGVAAGSEFGVASEAFIHAIKTLSDQGTGSRSWQFAAIDWVTGEGEKPSVLSLSFGKRGIEPIYTIVIDAATRQGVTVVVSAGDTGTGSSWFSPAHVKSAITVGATSSKNMKAFYSNFGSYVDILAPGSAIVSASAKSDTGSVTLQGTGLACPHVAGAAALLIESGLRSRDEIFASMQATGRVGLIGKLKDGDPDLFLWVGRDPAPAPPPTPAPSTPAPVRCPEWAREEVVDKKGNCKCPYGQKCSLDGGASYKCPSSMGIGGFNGKYFSGTCGNECKCYPYSI